MQAITTKHLPETRTRPSRISATTGSGLRAIVKCADDPAPYRDSHRKAAATLCARMNWDGTLITGWLRRGEYVHVFYDLRELTKLPKARKI